MPRHIAKVNARSIDGYFGEGTSCFFIRGTILSDRAVGAITSRWRFSRPGNIVEISWFDGTWAIVTIQTRSGNRAGDNVRARVYLREDDLKAVGVDCERIVAVNGLPFTFDVESLAGKGLFDYSDLEPHVVPEDDPPPPKVVASAPEASWTEPEPEPEPEPASREPEPAWREPEPPEPARIEPEPEPAPPEPEPQPADEPEPEVVAAVHGTPPPAPAPSAAPAPEPFDLGKFVEALRADGLPFEGNPLLQVGASVAAVAVPVLLYMALEYLKNNKPPDKDA